MSKPYSSQVVLAGALIVLMCMVSVFVMVGWHSQSFRATSFFIGTATMKYNSAVTFLVLAMGLLAVMQKAVKIQQASAIFAIAIASLTLLEYWLGLNLHIDELFVNDIWQRNAPGRMAPASAVCFLMAGVLLLTHHSFPHKHINLYDNLLTAYLTIPLFALFANIFAPEEVINTPLLDDVSFHTCVNFLCFVFALMLLTHSKGGAGLLTRDTRHGGNFRVLFFLVLVLPLTLGSVLRYAIQEQWIGSGIGIAIFCLFSTFITSIALAHHTIVLDHWVKQLLGEKRKSELLQNQIHELIEIAADGVLLFNGELQILHANTGAERILGYSHQEFTSMSLIELLNPSKSETAYLELQQYIRNPNSPQSLTITNRILFKHRKGNEVPVSISLTKKHQGDQVLLIAIIKNMSELDDRLKFLEKQAFVDPLTQTLNRAAFQSFTNRLTVQDLRKSDISFCVLLMDIDDFKSINDSFGHDAGDQVLIEFARSIKAVLRNGDRLFRTGGEEFIIITSNLSEEDAGLFAERVRKAVEECSITYDETPIKVTCSIGVCIIDSHRGEILEAVKLADAAMYQAKKNGKNQVRIAESEAPTEPAQPE